MSTQKKKSSFLKGAAILAVGSIFARFLGIFFKVPLIRLFDDYTIGLYGYPYPIYSFLTSLSVIGLPLAVSKMTSERVSMGDYASAEKIFKVSRSALTILGAFGTFLMIVLANPMIKLFGWEAETYYSILGLSLTPLFVSFMAAYRGYFQGLQMMTPTSLSQIVESVIRVVVGLSLAYMLYPAVGAADRIAQGKAAGGASFGAAAGAFAGSLLMVVLYAWYRKNRKVPTRTAQTQRTLSSKAIIRTLIRIAIPASLSSIVVSLMNMINSVTVSTCLQRAGYTSEQATEMWGLLSGGTQTLVNVPLLLGVAISAALVPAISAAVARKDARDIREKTAEAVRASMIVSIPCAVGLSILAAPILTLLFNDSAGYTLLQTLAFSCITTILLTSCQAVLQGLGKMTLPVINLGIGAVVKIVLNLILIPTKTFNIQGAVIATLIADVVIVVLNYRAIKKYTKFKTNIVNMYIKPILCSIIMGAAALFSYVFLVDLLGNSIATIAAIAIGGILYLITMIICGGIEKSEVRAVLKRK